jgi:hypothetical protein
MDYSRVGKQIKQVCGIGEKKEKHKHVQNEFSGFVKTFHFEKAGDCFRFNNRNIKKIQESFYFC